MARKRDKKTSQVSNIINIVSNQNQTTSHHIPKLRQKDLITFEPLTFNQSSFFSEYNKNNPFILLLGFAGCGKTFIALYKALEQILRPGQPIKKIIIIRSSVQSRDIGHLPGDTKEKLSAFELPYKQITKEIFGRGDAWHLLKESNQVEFESTSFLRGTTFENSVIIVDECQSMNWHEINTIATRIGNNSRIVFCGDFKQNDLIKTKSDVSGFNKFIEVTSLMPSHFKINFEIDDIVRSGICKEWITAIDKYDNNIKQKRQNNELDNKHTIFLRE